MADLKDDPKCLYCGIAIDPGTLKKGVNKCPECGRTIMVSQLQTEETSSETPPTEASPSAKFPSPPPLNADVPVGKRPIRKKFVRRKSGARVAQIKCTSCGAPIEVKNQAMSEMVTCSYCGAVLDLTSDDNRILRKILLDKRPASPLQLGTKGILKGIEWEVIGRVRMVESGRYYWDEFLLFSPSHGYAWLQFEDGHWTYLRKSKTKPLFDPKISIPKVTFHHYGKKFTVVEKSVAQINYIEGEFPYHAEVGDRIQFMDAVSPPLILCAEWTEEELEWINGEYFQPSSIKEAFKLTKIPKPGGVARHQPYRKVEWRSQLAKVSTVYAIIFLLLMFMAFLKGARIAQFTVPPEKYLIGGKPEAVAEPYVSPAFKFNRKTIAKVKFYVPLSNEWVFLNAELLDANQEPVMAFTKEISYYSGSDWSEGSKKGSAVFKVEEPGEYFLSIEGEGGSGEYGTTPPNRQLTVTVYTGVLVARFFVLLLIICLIFPLIEGIRYFSYQQKRVGDLYSDEDD